MSGGAQADAAIVPLIFLDAVIAQHEVSVLGQIGEEPPWRLSGIFVSAKTADERRNAVERYLRAYRKGVRELRRLHRPGRQAPGRASTAAITAGGVATGSP